MTTLTQDNNQTLMQNAFDFHYIQVTSTRKTDFYKQGIAKQNLQSKVDYSGRFPKTYYTATIAFFDVQSNWTTAQIDAVRDEWKDRMPADCKVKVGYHCSD